METSRPADPVESPPAAAPAANPAPKLSLRPVYTALTFVFGILLGAGGLFAYQEYIAVPEVGSFEECIKAKGSITQESYPATCITKDKKRFIQPIDEDPLLNVPVTTYTSMQAYLTLTFPQPMFVTDTVTDNDGWQRGAIVISTQPGGDESKTNLTIVYGIPAIDGKGGACIGKDGKSLWQKKTILNNSVNVCDTGSNLHAGYPVNPTEKIEYAFFIGGNLLTEEDFSLYKGILYEGVTFSPGAQFPMETFTCPKTEWVDCMPGPNQGMKIECTSEFLSWAKTSCPGFQGAAY